ncbi:MAG: hypothetical protein NTW67_04205 [Candidatus Woesearchaeota archaeon]|nr:hypothetical protein [Candidatus Woesearchaeota archaeon]
MEKFEVLLERAHFETLMKTNRFDRGFLIGSLDSGLFVAQSSYRLPPGRELIVHTDIKQIISKALPECKAFIPYINDSDKNRQNGYAIALLQAEENTRLKRSFAYCIINGDVRFKRVVRYSGKEGYVFKDVLFGLRGEDSKG